MRASNFPHVISTNTLGEPTWHRSDFCHVQFTPREPDPGLVQVRVLIVAMAATALLMLTAARLATL